MFRKLRNKKAQNTAEYAILIALVIGAVVAMQTYAQRALQGRIRDASRYMKTQTTDLGSTGQYEPYYTCTTSETKRDTDDSFNNEGAKTSSKSTTTGKVEQTTLDAGMPTGE